MKVLKLRKKPVEIEAVLLEPNRQSIANAMEFMGHKPDTSLQIACDRFDEYCDARIEDGYLSFKTLESEDHRCCFGDYIFKGVKGEFYSCKADIKELTYDDVTAYSDVTSGE